MSTKRLLRTNKSSQILNKIAHLYKTIFSLKKEHTITAIKKNIYYYYTHTSIFFVASIICLTLFIANTFIEQRTKFYQEKTAQIYDLIFSLSNLSHKATALHLFALHANNTGSFDAIGNAQKTLKDLMEKVKTSHLKYNATAPTFFEHLVSFIPGKKNANNSTLNWLASAPAITPLSIENIEQNTNILQNQVITDSITPQLLAHYALAVNSVNTTLEKAISLAKIYENSTDTPTPPPFTYLQKYQHSQYDLITTLYSHLQADKEKHNLSIPLPPLSAPYPKALPALGNKIPDPKMPSPLPTQNEAKTSFHLIKPSPFNSEQRYEIIQKLLTLKQEQQKVETALNFSQNALLIQRNSTTKSDNSNLQGAFNMEYFSTNPLTQNYGFYENFSNAKSNSERITALLNITTHHEKLSILQNSIAKAIAQQYNSTSFGYTKWVFQLLFVLAFLHFGWINLKTSIRIRHEQNSHKQYLVRQLQERYQIPMNKMQDHATMEQQLLHLCTVLCSRAPIPKNTNVIIDKNGLLSRVSALNSQSPSSINTIRTSKSLSELELNIAQTEALQAHTHTTHPQITAPTDNSANEINLEYAITTINDSNINDSNSLDESKVLNINNENSSANPADTKTNIIDTTNTTAIKSKTNKHNESENKKTTSQNADSEYIQAEYIEEHIEDEFSFNSNIDENTQIIVDNNLMLNSNPQRALNHTKVHLNNEAIIISEREAVEPIFFEDAFLTKNEHNTQMIKMTKEQALDTIIKIVKNSDNKDEWATDFYNSFIDKNQNSKTITNNAQNGSTKKFFKKTNQSSSVLSNINNDKPPQQDLKNEKPIISYTPKFCGKIQDPYHSNKSIYDSKTKKELST